MTFVKAVSLTSRKAFQSSFWLLVVFLIILDRQHHSCLSQYMFLSVSIFTEQYDRMFLILPLASP